MELRRLLDSGLKAYYVEPEKLSHEDKKQIIKAFQKIISPDALEKESVLELVLNFYMTNIHFKRIDSCLKCDDMQGMAYLESDGKYLEVQDFLRKHICFYSFNKEEGIPYYYRYKKQREAYYNDKEILASIKDFGIDPDQFWYLLQFCKDYVMSLTKGLEKRYLSVREDLNMLVNEISKMGFDNEEWDKAYPRSLGEMTVKVEDNHKITNYKTLHLLMRLVKDYLNKKHDYETNIYLDAQEFQQSKDLIKYMYCINNEEHLTDKEREFLDSYNPWLDKSKDTKYDSKSDSRRMALFTYYIEQFLKGKEGQKKYVYEYYPDYNQGVGINHNKLFLISKLIYIMSDIHKIPIEKRQKLRDDSTFLKDCLKGYRIIDQKGVEECLSAINREGLTNS